MPIRIAAICIAAALLAGCCKTVQPKPPYYGPTLDTYSVVEQVNANNELIPTLWTTTRLEVSVTDDKGHESSYSGEGELDYRRPAELFLNGAHVLGTRLFEMGSNADDYWLIIPELKKAWWGHHRNDGKPCVQGLPIRPDLLVEVLGVSTNNINLLERPVPVMRFNHDDDSYMFVWHDRLPDRWFATKEIWYDRATLSPKLVLLYDTRGRVILKAKLSNPRPINIPELPPARWPKMATRYELQFPESKAGLTVEITDAKLTTRTKRKVIVPNNNTFATPTEWAEDLKVIQVDKGCGD